MKRREPYALAAVPLIAAGVLIAAYGGVQPQWYLPVFAALYLGAGIWAVTIVWRGAPAHWHAAYVPLAALVALPLAQWAAHTTSDPAATQAAFLAILAAACAFLLITQAVGRGDGARVKSAILIACAAAGSGLAAWAIVQYSLFPNRIWGAHLVTVATPVGPFVDHDDFAACMELLLPAGLALSLRPRRSSVPSLAWAAASALMIAAVVLSASRAGAGCIALEIAAFAMYLWRAGSPPAPALRRSMVGLGLATLALGYSLAVGFGPLWQRLQRSEVDAQVRWHLAASSLQMGAARPWLGWGLGSWSSVYPRYAQFDNGLFFAHAHSEYMQWWAEAGLTGWLLLLALAACILPAWLGARLPSFKPRGSPAAKRRPDPDARALAALLRRSRASERLPNLAFRVAAIVFLVHASIDFLVHIPALLITFALVAGAAGGDSPNHDGRGHARMSAVAGTPSIELAEARHELRLS